MGEEPKGVQGASLVSAIVGMLPSVISLVQSLFAHQNPGVPPPTSAEVKLAFAQACMSSLAVDDAWLAAHPKT